MVFELVVTFLLAAIVALTVTAAVRFLMLRVGVLDVPNFRSSHSRPTPTLGGIGIVAGTAAALVFGCGVLQLPLPLSPKALVGSTLILCVLCYDEIRPMGRLSKLIVQAGASLLLIEAGVVLHRVSFPGFGQIALGTMALPVTFLWLVGHQNLYDFMDGIDGMAGMEGLLVAGLITGLSVSFAPVLTPFSAALAGAALGFLLLNFPPARIFMGDVGGHFLGLMFGAVAIIGEAKGIPFVVTVLFLGAFLFDSVYTIFRRLLRGENITLAHRTHIYQRLTMLGWSHRRVDFWFAVCTLLLGGTGYLMAFGYAILSLVVGGMTGVLMVGGTVWVERRWRMVEEQTKGQGEEQTRGQGDW